MRKCIVGNTKRTFFLKLREILALPTHTEHQSLCPDPAIGLDFPFLALVVITAVSNV